MATIIDYVKANSQRSFDQFPLNDVDILCLNEIGYITLGEALATSYDLSQEICLRDVWLDYRDRQEKPDYNFLVTKDRVDLIKEMVSSERFADLRLSHYVSEISDEFEKQFAAMVFSLPEINHTQLVFRGTDDTLIGWKEDFQMTYVREIPAQRSAITYLKDFLGQYPGKIVLSGHSKGGNLALYVASHVNEDQQEKISAIYMFDAPGLQEEGLHLLGYQAIRDKIKVIRPEESIVGVMLYNDASPEIINSHSFGILQHATTNWKVDVENGTFEPAEKATDLSLNLEKTFKQWTEELSNQELKVLFDTLFDTLISSGITSLNDLSFNLESGSKLATAIASFNSIGTEKKLIIAKSAKLFAAAFTEYSRLALLEKKANFSLPDLTELRQIIENGINKKDKEKD